MAVAIILVWDTTSFLHYLREVLQIPLSHWRSVLRESSRELYNRKNIKQIRWQKIKSEMVKCNCSWNFSKHSKKNQWSKNDINLSPIHKKICFMNKRIIFIKINVYTISSSLSRKANDQRMTNFLLIPKIVYFMKRKLYY